MQAIRLGAMLALSVCISSCDEDGQKPTQVATAPTPPPTPTPVTAVSETLVATFERPWAVKVLPDGRLIVTEKAGALRIVSPAGGVSAPVAGLPAVSYFGSQGGLMDVVLHPGFAQNRVVYLSYVEEDATGMGVAVARATLAEAGGAANLNGLQVIWRAPKVALDGNFGGRLGFGPDGKLYITSGDRPTGASPDDLTTSQGKIVRINDDGSIPFDNPFVGTTGALPEIWSSGHRNPYGLAWDSGGRLWETEMGPKGGDELNLILKGRSYGWYFVSEGDNYNDIPIPRHSTRPEYVAPVLSWTPVIAPGGFIIYRGTRFTGWTGQGISTGLISKGLVRIQFNGESAAEVQRIDLGQRIRDIAEAPDGSLLVLEDHPGGRLLRLTPG